MRKFIFLSLFSSLHEITWLFSGLEADHHFVAPVIRQMIQHSPSKRIFIAEVKEKLQTISI